MSGSTPTSTTRRPRSEGQGVIIDTPQRMLRRFFRTSVTYNTALGAAGSKHPTIVEPVTDPLTGRYMILPQDNWLRLSFFGGDTNDNAGTYSIWGWDLMERDHVDANDLWVPYFLASGTFTLDSSSPGAANSPVPAAEFFADTITVVSDKTYTVPGATPESADDGVAWMFFDAGGHGIVEVQISRDTAGTPASRVNGVYRTL